MNEIYTPDFLKSDVEDSDCEDAAVTKKRKSDSDYENDASVANKTKKTSKGKEKKSGKKSGGKKAEKNKSKKLPGILLTKLLK